MSHECCSHGAAEHGPHFTPEEAADLRASDRFAARNFVSLMVGIFVLGLGLYVCVAVICSRGVP